MPKKRRDVEKGLKKKGFVKSNKAHKTFRYVAENGEETAVVTHCSHGPVGRELTDGLLSSMAAQCQLTNSQFHELISCTLNVKQYEAILRAEGLLSPTPDAGEPSS